MSRRVFILPDNSIRLGLPVKGREPEESNKDYHDRVIGEHRDGYPYVDVPVSELPTEPSREKWRWDGEKVIVDASVVTEVERLAALEDEIDRELESENPDPIKIARLMRKKEKREF